MNEITLIIDANYCCYVSKFAYSKGLTYLGNSTEIIFGFLRKLLELAEQFETKKFIFCWDSPKLFRKDIYPEYKANRHIEKTPEEKEADILAYKQFDEIRKIILPELGFKRNYQVEGYESDDLIASIVKNGSEKYVVVSSDEDLFQLLDYCSLFHLTHKNLTTKRIFEREYKISPSKWVDVKCITGCSTDNVKGIFGVGQVNAIKYLKDELGKETAKYKSIIGNPEIIERNRKLIELPFEGLSFQDFIPTELFYKNKFEEIFKKYGFKSMLDGSTKWDIKKWVKTFRLIDTAF